MSRLYATLGIFVFIGLAWWQYSSAITDRNKYKGESAKYQAELIAQQTLIKEKEILLAEANSRATKYLEDKKVIEDEAKANNECIAAGTCGVVVRYKQTICASMPSAASTKSGINDTSRTNSADFARWYVTLEEALKKNELKIANLQKDLLIRSNPNYCVGTQQNK